MMTLQKSFLFLSMVTSAYIYAESEDFQHLFQNDFNSFVLRPKDGVRIKDISGISSNELWTLLPELDRTRSELEKIHLYSKNELLNDHCLQMKQNADLLVKNLLALKSFLLKSCVDSKMLSTQCHAYRDRQENSTTSARILLSLFKEKCVTRVSNSENDFRHTSLKFGPLGSFRWENYSDSDAQENRIIPRGMFMVNLEHMNDVFSTHLESQVGISTGGFVHELKNDWIFHTKNRNYDLGIKQTIYSTADSFFIQDLDQVKKLSEISGEYSFSPKVFDGENYWRGIYQPSIFLSSDSSYSGFLHTGHFEIGSREDKFSSESYYSLSFAKFLPNSSSFYGGYQEWSLRRILRKVFLGHSQFQSEIGLKELRGSEGNAQLVPHFRFQWVQPLRSALYHRQRSIRLEESHYHAAQVLAEWSVRRTFFSPQAQSLNFEASHTMEFNPKNRFQIMGRWRRDRATPYSAKEVSLESIESALRFESEIRERMWIKTELKFGQSVLNGNGLAELPTGLWANPHSSARFVELLGALLYEF